MEDNFDYIKYLKNNPLLNENQLTESEQEKVDRANKFFIEWGPNGESGKKFRNLANSFREAYNKKYGL